MFDSISGDLRNYREQYQAVSNLLEWANDISGQWNGDEPGDQEQAANCADEIIIKCYEIRELIDEMEQYNV